MTHAALARLAQLHTEMAGIYRDLAAEADVPVENDRILSLPEAAARLGVTRGWLIRRDNWQRAGGFKGPDRRVHFALSDLDRYLKGR